MTTSEAVQILATVVTAIAAIFASISAAIMYRVRAQVEKESKGVRERQKQMLQEMSEFSTQLMSGTLRVAPQYA